MTAFLLVLAVMLAACTALPFARSDRWWIRILDFPRLQLAALSHTTRLFQKLSGLLDPRRGRGMVNTFHARYFFARWPLDYLFHSEHFRLARIVRGPAYGSDHFPVYVELELDPEARHSQQAPDADGGDRQEADRKLQKAAAKDDPDA